MREYWALLARDGWLPPVHRTAPLPALVHEDERQLARAELDAIVAREVYGLDRSEVAYVLDAFPIVERRDIEQYGEYRTKRVILEIYDAMAEVARTGKPSRSRLDPPQADPRLAHPDTRRGTR